MTISLFLITHLNFLIFKVAAGLDSSYIFFLHIPVLVSN